MPVHPSPPPPRWRWLALAPALFCLACSGGPKLNSVQGKVLHKGQPVKGAAVTFHPKGANEVTAVRPYGQTGEDGTFTLTTGDKQGAPAGDYTVTISCPEEVAPRKKGAPSMEAPETRDRFQDRYSNPGTSKFKVTITNGSNQVEPFDLN